MIQLLVFGATPILFSQVSSFSTNVVLVGHSLGGLTVPVVASERSVREMVMLCAVVPVAGMSYSAVIEAEPELATAHGRSLTDGVAHYRDGTIGVSADIAKLIYYHDCSAGDAEWASRILRRQAS
jgi:predicted alpha/beta hydrolase family esterase